MSRLFCGGGGICVESLQPDAEGADVGLQFLQSGATSLFCLNGIHERVCTFEVIILKKCDELFQLQVFGLLLLDVVIAAADDAVIRFGQHVVGSVLFLHDLCFGAQGCQFTGNRAV